MSSCPAGSGRRPDAVAANDEVLVVILTGAGRPLWPGRHRPDEGPHPVQAKKFGSYGNQVFLKLENFP